MLSAVRKTVLVFYFHVAILKSSVSAEGDYKWCAYKFYMHPETWDKAKAVCAANRMTLARITDTAQHAYLTSYVNDQLIKQNPTIQTQVWIGLRKDEAGSIKLEDCNLYSAADYNPVKNLHKDCVYFDADQPTFLAEECVSSKAFLCQASALDLNDCFTYKMVSLITSGWNFKGAEVEYIRPGPDDCSSLCTDDCVAYAHSNGKCVPMTRHSCPCSFNGYYTVKGVLNTEAHKGISDVGIDNFCGNKDVASSPPEIVFSSLDALVKTPEVPVPSFKTLISSSSAFVSTSEVRVATPNVIVSSHGVSESSLGALSSLPDVHVPVINSTPDVPVINSTPDTLSFSAVVIAPTSTSETPTPPCFCSCGENKNETMSVEEILEKIKELKSQLSVDKKDLSSWKRKLTSAPDERTSATGIGMFGVAILVIVGGLVMVLDAPRLLVEIRRLTKIVDNKCKPQNRQAWEAP